MDDVGTMIDGNQTGWVNQIMDLLHDQTLFNMIGVIQTDSMFFYLDKYLSCRVYVTAQLLTHVILTQNVNFFFNIEQSSIKVIKVSHLRYCHVPVFEHDDFLRVTSGELKD